MDAGGIIRIESTLDGIEKIQSYYKRF